MVFIAEKESSNLWVSTQKVSLWASLEQIVMRLVWRLVELPLRCRACFLVKYPPTNSLLRKPPETPLRLSPQIRQLSAFCIAPVFKLIPIPWFFFGFIGLFCLPIVSRFASIFQETFSFWLWIFQSRRINGLSHYLMLAHSFFPLSPRDLTLSDLRSRISERVSLL